MNKQCCKVHALSLGLTLGIIWGLGMFLTGLLATWCEAWGHKFVEVMGSIYIGFEPTYLGSVIGLAWGFVDAFIGGLIIAWIYNCFLRCCCKGGVCSSKTSSPSGSEPPREEV